MTLPVYMWTQVRFPQTLPTILALGTCIFMGSIILIGTAEWLRRMGAQQTKTFAGDKGGRQNMTDDVGGRRQGGRSANTRRNAAAVKQIPWGLPRNSDKPTEPLDEDAVHAVHDGAMRVLEEIGIEFLHEEAKQNPR